MSTTAVINVDLADVWEKRGRGRNDFVRTLSWGDEVRVISAKSTHIEIETVAFRKQPDGSSLAVDITGFIEPAKSSGIKAADVLIPKSKKRVLSVNFVDVQQGDGAVIEGPDGKVILVDGGDSQLFARYLAGRYRDTTLAKPQKIECILVTHGDADHFAGLPLIHASEINATKRKRLFIEPKRVYHNGIVKRPGKKNNKSVPDVELLGATKKLDGKTILTGLEENLLKVPDAEMNEPFRKWKAALAVYNGRSKIEFRRLEFGDDDAFEFFNDPAHDLRIEVLGPLTIESGAVRGLRFLGNPPKGPRIGQESLSVGEEDFKGHSASHTINGHSIVFRLSYGGISYLFTGDLNDESSRFLAREHNAGRLNLKAEVFKVPHHGSADFSGAFVQSVSPIVSVVSSGDESARKEYIHPRATLMGALGRWSRVAEPLIFVTELVAFFTYEDLVRLVNDKEHAKRGNFHGFSRAAFGLVKTRTDGQRLLVFTDSANLQMKEAYAYQLSDAGLPEPSPVMRA